METRLLLIEDQDVLRSTLAAFLERDPDMEVCAAVGSGEEALPLVEGHDPDLIVVDASLPGMTGIEVIRRVQDSPRPIPCLMFSGRSESMIVQNARDAGAAGYVVKGDPSQICKAVRSILDGEAYVSRQVRQHWLA